MSFSESAWRVIRQVLANGPGGFHTVTEVDQKTKPAYRLEQGQGHIIPALVHLDRPDLLAIPDLLDHLDLLDILDKPFLLHHLGDQVEDLEETESHIMAAPALGDKVTWDQLD